MTKIGIGLPGLSIADAKEAAEAASQYAYDSFSVYGDLGDLPPYAVLHSVADVLASSNISSIGPMGVPVGLQHSELIAMHATALEEQIPGHTYVGLVRGAFLDAIGEKPAKLANMQKTVEFLRSKFEETNLHIPICIGGFGQKVLNLAGKLAVDGVKLGGSTNPELAELARRSIDNPEVKVTLGAVSVIDANRKAARALARREVGKYLYVVGSLDTTLDADEASSLARFAKKIEAHDSTACDSISDSLLDKFALAGTPEHAISVLQKMDGKVDRFEFGTPHGLHGRANAIHYIGQSIIKELGA
jgi:5,10-methylenetetrahydromethanopterin reductase